ncbi:hypothetical protein NDU88_004456 [Pleurodeles waltl]|uniref:Uncharacterized protein n=1 Tax=Pleurodeles waltl TaxID=8319 RepID=A0AAV7L1Z4_PLEWA|nr:hypothetical protein NDU88_004456 [Pleurodeles waltl]
MAEQSRRQKVQDSMGERKNRGTETLRMAEQSGRQKVQDQRESAQIKAQRRREWQSKAESRRWRDRRENSGTAQIAKAQSTGWALTSDAGHQGRGGGLRTCDRSRGRGWGEASQQGGAVGAGERAPAERSGLSLLVVHARVNL